MNKLQYHSNEFFVLWNFPEEPKILTVNARVEYEKVVKACIAAKTRIDNKELLPVVNYAEHCDSGETGWFYQDRYEHSHPTGLKGIKDGDIFDLSDNVEFEEGEEFIANDHWFPIDLKDKYEGKTILHPDDLEDLRKSGRTRRVIHLKLKQEITPFEKAIKEKEESQDELWTEVTRLHNIYAFKELSDKLKSKFTIHRK